MYVVASKEVLFCNSLLRTVQMMSASVDSLILLSKWTSQKRLFVYIILVFEFKPLSLTAGLPVDNLAYSCLNYSINRNLIINYWMFFFSGWPRWIFIDSLVNSFSFSLVGVELLPKQQNILVWLVKTTRLQRHCKI